MIGVWSFFLKFKNINNMKKLIIGIGIILLLGIATFFLFPQLYFSSAFGQRIIMKIMNEQTAEFYFKSNSKDSLYMKGVIYSNTLKDLKAVLKENPNITTLIMEEVPGSIDDNINLLASREIRRRGINTYIPENGMVASGGTDMFLAGTKRNIGSNAKIGVHSWSDGEKEGREYPKDSELHNMFLVYYKEMNIPVEFYWFTLDAAPADGNHNMTPNEMKRYSILNQ